MQLTEVQEIIDCLPNGQTPFWYFRDRYALLLLGMLGDEIGKRQVKRSTFSQLLDKAVVKSVFAEHRGRAVPRDAFEYRVAASPESYSLTLDTWGSNKDWWMQTTRRGYNLVLQLNFPPEHDQAYRRLVDPEGEMPFVCFDHPVIEKRRSTLAWSRFDVDLGNGEALIEEIQTDWLRFAKEFRQQAERARGRFGRWGFMVHKEAMIEYFDEEMTKHLHWDEAMLAASVWFLRRELGIRTIFYHTPESGAAIKRTGYRQPPRSIYSRLPRRFCFRQTDRRPAFMSKKIRTNCSKKAVARAKFQVLEFEGPAGTGS